MRYPESESSIMEFKRELPKNDQILKTVIGFCNQNGGKLIIGVADNGEIEGLSIKDLEYALNSIKKPSLRPHIPLSFPVFFPDDSMKKASLK